MFSNDLKISINYVTNFQPNISDKTLTFLTKNNWNKNSSKIFCKNFLIFLIILKNTFSDKNPKIFIKPKYISLNNILRAPYKNKISKHQITLSRYTISVSFKFNFKNLLYFYNLNSLFFFLNTLKEFYSFFETNICFQHKSVLVFKFFLLDFFKLSNYK